jgi:colanic acid/amylovoran biosynthesis glycosyltransferase
MTPGDPRAEAEPAAFRRTPMRVAVLVRRFPKLSETFILNQITGLLEGGVDVDVFAWTPGDGDAVHSEVRRFGLMQRTHYLQPPASRMGRILGTLATVGSRRGAWRRPSLIVRSLDVRRYGRSASSLSLLHAGATFFRGGPYDLVHCQFGHLGLSALTLREIGAFRGRLVVSFRGWDLTAHEDEGGYRALFRIGDLFLPVCGAFRDRLIGMGCDPGKIQVHRSGIDLSKFDYAVRTRGPDQPTRLLTVARLVEKKGIEFGVRAVARLRESGRAVVYTIVGDGPLRPELQGLVEELGLSDVVRFEGPKDHAGVMEALAGAHMLLAPSVTAADGDQEGIPNALKEAMATGLPVVSTMHSGIPELVEDRVSGFLVPEADPAALADRVAFLADRPKEWAAMGRAGRARIEAEYDIRTLNHRLMVLYDDLL